MPLRQAIPLGLQHVFAMFVGNLTPLLIITSACGLAGGEFADLQVSLLQNAMFVAGVVTLVQLFSIGPVGGQVPIIMGTSSGFLGVFNSVAASMGGGVLAYGAIMGASILGGLFETVLGFFLKPLRKFFPSVVTGTVVLSIGLSLISVGVNSFGGGNAAKDFGSAENLLLAVFVLVVILFFKHWTTGFLSSSSILIGIVAALIMNHTAFRGKPVPFVMELPNYRLPSAKSVGLLLWEKAKDFLQRAFTVIFLATIIIWFLQGFDTRLNVVADSSYSLLALIGQWIAPLFAPLGFADWRCATALISGFVAKESVVSTLEVLLGGAAVTGMFSPRAAISFLVFTLLYTPLSLIHI